MTPILALGFLFSALTAHFFPTQIAADEPLQNRAGNAVGRLTNATWKSAKPGLANAYVQSRVEQQSQGQQPTGLSGVTVGNERLVKTAAGPANSSPTSGASGVHGVQGLDSEARKAVEEFLK